MWCELVLNGVGGSTIAEAKLRLSYTEYATWAQYRAERGSLNAGRRIEQTVGHLSYMTAMINSKPNSGLKPSDFMPHEPVQKPKELDALEAFKNFAGI